jgi:hypothetical protein
MKFIALLTKKSDELLGNGSMLWYMFRDFSELDDFALHLRNVVHISHIFVKQYLNYYQVIIWSSIVIKSETNFFILGSIEAKVQ